jgi:hypothetical protein
MMHLTRPSLSENRHADRRDGGDTPPAIGAIANGTTPGRPVARLMHVFGIGTSGSPTSWQTDPSAFQNS